MVVYSSNIEGVISVLVRKVAEIGNVEEMLRKMALASVAMIKDRVHGQGLDSDNQSIGEYEDPYLTVRQKKFNRTADTKVILSLTGQMENDLSVIATERGYGVGYKNDFNFQKSKWNEDHFGKDIFSHPDNELDVIDEIAQNHVADAIS